MRALVTVLLFVFLAANCAGQSAPSTDQPASDSLFHFIDFSVVQKEGKALLRWRCDSLEKESFYTIERSDNGNDFSFVGLTRNAESGWQEYSDDASGRGKVYYRLKLSAGDAVSYSRILTVNMDMATSHPGIRFYPNPIDKVLIVRSDLNYDLQISDGSGKALITQKIEPGPKVIDVSALSPGIYVLTLYQKETNKLVTEKLMKK